MRNIALLWEGGVIDLALCGCPIFGAVGSEGHLISVYKVTCPSDYVDGDLASSGCSILGV